MHHDSERHLVRPQIGSREGPLLLVGQLRVRPEGREDGRASDQTRELCFGHRPRPARGRAQGRLEPDGTVSSARPEPVLYVIDSDETLLDSADDQRSGRRVVRRLGSGVDDRTRAAGEPQPAALDERSFVSVVARMETQAIRLLLAGAGTMTKIGRR